MRFRFLPVFILLAMLGTGIKLAGLWHGLGGPAPAFAAGGQPLQTAAGEAAPDDAGAAPADARPVPDGPIPEGQITDLSTDIFEMTDEELQLLQSLSQRREELEQRAREIDEREVLLKAAEQRIDQKIKDLEQLQATIEALLVQHDEQS